MNIDWETLNLDPQLLWADYILPWGTQIVTAILVFFIGRMIAAAVTKGARRIMEKAKLDAMLVNFLANILGSVLLLLPCCRSGLTGKVFPLCPGKDIRMHIGYAQAGRFQLVQGSEHHCRRTTGKHLHAVEAGKIFADHRM